MLHSIFKNLSYQMRWKCKNKVQQWWKAKILPYTHAIAPQWWASIHKLPMAVDKKSTMAAPWPLFNNTGSTKTISNLPILHLLSLTPDENQKHMLHSISLHFAFPVFLIFIFHLFDQAHP